MMPQAAAPAMQREIWAVLDQCARQPSYGKGGTHTPTFSHTTYTLGTCRIHTHTHTTHTHTHTPTHTQARECAVGRNLDAQGKCLFSRIHQSVI